ncbi:MAG: DUF5606 domain-containing protein [Bacteroidetes bacterium]|nr:DUF5606 domain-containing protein [Bacteroidota bacterium]
MDYHKIISITGLSGLFELIGSKNDGAIVRSLDDGSTKFVSSRIHNFSHLEGIEVYTENDNVNLAEVLLAMKDSSEKLPDLNNAADIKAYFVKVYPNMDFSRVYTSDLKKMVKWYNTLKAANVEIKLPEEETAEETAEIEEPVLEKEIAPVEEEAAPKKPARKKKTES